MLRTYVNRSPRLFWAGGVMLGLGLALNVWWAFHSGFYLYQWLFNFSPGLLLLLTAYLVTRFQRGRWIWVGLGLFFTVLLTLFVGVINLLGYAFDSATRPITDVGQYAAVRSELGELEHVQHFPIEIPREATLAQFYYQPGALQGGMGLQLRVQLPPETWQTLKAQYEAEAQYTFSAEDVNAVGFEEPVPIPLLRVGDEEPQLFSDTHTVFVLGEQSSDVSYGVALNETPAEIVYWSQEW